MKQFFCLLLWGLLVVGCSNPVPKPSAYYRIALPEKREVSFENSISPFSFVYNSVSTVEFFSNGKDFNWFVFDYPLFQAKVLCTYSPIGVGGFRRLAEENHTFVFRHSVKAQSIDEERIGVPGQRVYGLFYTLKGEVATPIQFMVTDSTRNFFRGALYLDCVPNPDSLKPVVAYIKADMLRVLNSMKWER
jgi:gliding motility-associated lipoprotein GldD